MLIYEARAFTNAFMMYVSRIIAFGHLVQARMQEKEESAVVYMEAGI
jgi:hypothetical protein